MFNVIKKQQFHVLKKIAVSAETDKTDAYFCKYASRDTTYFKENFIQLFSS